MSRIGWDRVEDYEAPEDDTGIRGRLLLLRVIVVVAMVVLVYRVYWLQQTRGDELQTHAEENQLARLTIDPPRGGSSPVAGRQAHSGRKTSERYSP